MLYIYIYYILYIYYIYTYIQTYTNKHIYIKIHGLILMAIKSRYFTNFWLVCQMNQNKKL